MQPNTVPQNDNKHFIGGLMSIICGVVGVLTMFFLIFVIILTRFTLNQARAPGIPGLPMDISTLVTVMYGAFGLFYLVLGILGIVAGAAALKRQHWELALAGAVAGTLTFFPCGIVAVIFISLGRSEFTPPPLFNLPGMQTK
jgi:hypothetical protein